ncbi:hypothetical protein BKA69DRAFT_1122798 [Paraphysoderma sedebokerense]|nr:hypothetical protein BKA69DRAFT_1122798 [Paraphysoderma sedebokerense]
MDTRTGISSLATEILFEITGYLDKRTLKRCCRVSQLFFDCSAPRLWERLSTPPPAIPGRYIGKREHQRLKRYLENLKILSSYLKFAPSTRPYASFVKQIDFDNWPVSQTAFNKQILPFFNQNILKFTNLRRLSLPSLDANLIQNDDTIRTFGEKVAKMLGKFLPRLKNLEYLSFPCTDARSLCVCLTVKEFERAWSRIECIHLRQLFGRLDIVELILAESPNIHEIDIGFKKANLMPVITPDAWFKMIHSPSLKHINVAEISFPSDPTIQFHSTSNITSLSILLYESSEEYWEDWVFESLPNLTDLEIIESDYKVMKISRCDISWVEPLLPRLKSLRCVGTMYDLYQSIEMAHNLEHLDLRGVELASFPYLRNFPRLKELIINQCLLKDDRQIDMAKFLCRIPTLRCLTIIDMFFDADFYDFFIKHNTQIRNLSIHFGEYMDRFYGVLNNTLPTLYKAHPDISWPQIEITYSPRDFVDILKWNSANPQLAEIVHFKLGPYRPFWYDGSSDDYFGSYSLWEDDLQNDRLWDDDMGNGYLWFDESLLE